jgi:CheY-like chemotaxis protein
MTTPAPPICCACTDLLFSTKIKGTADALSIPMKMVRNISGLEAHGGASIGLLVDMGLDADDPLELIRAGRQLGMSPIVAFISHVEAELAEQAAASGADSVLPRSQFSARLPELLSNGLRLP